MGKRKKQMETPSSFSLSGSDLPPPTTPSEKPFYRTWIGIFVIVIVLALLGVNIFLYLAKGTDTLAQVSKRILGMVGGITKNILSESAKGVEETAKKVDTTLVKVADAIPPPSQPPSNISQPSAKKDQVPEPMDSEMLAGYSTTGPGYCFIGEEQGYRTCAEVGPNDICMSGNIFPTSDICMNPTLRQ